MQFEMHLQQFFKTFLIQECAPKKLQSQMSIELCFGKSLGPSLDSKGEGVDSRLAESTVNSIMEFFVTHTFEMCLI